MINKQIISTGAVIAQKWCKKNISLNQRDLLSIHCNLTTGGPRHRTTQEAMFYVDHSPGVIRGPLGQCISGHNVTDANPKTEETDDILSSITNLVPAIIHRYNFDLGFLKYSCIKDN